MPSSRTELQRLFDEHGGLLPAPDDPALARLLHRMATEGSVRRIVPGLFARPDLADDPATRIRALATWLPDVVITGDAAARWTFWPERAVTSVTAAHRRARVAPAGFALTRQTIPVELRQTVHGVQVTCPALTALDLAAAGSGEGIDRALLARACTLADMHTALRLTPGRPDNAVRRAHTPFCGRAGFAAGSPTSRSAAGLGSTTSTWPSSESSWRLRSTASWCTPDRSSSIATGRSGPT